MDTVTPHQGTLALAGGAEFMEGMAEVDRELLRELGESPRVAIVPTAAAMERPDKAAANGVEHFRRLGASAEAVMIVDQRTANDAQLVAALARKDVIYLAGGSPRLLLSILAGSTAWEAILKRHLEGATLAGSSAGAMVLCEKMRARDADAGWGEALGLVKGVAVLPHFNRRETTSGWIDQVIETVPPALTLLGIDEGSAALRRRGEWRAIGAGGVTLVSAEMTASYTKGQIFKI